MSKELLNLKPTHVWKHFHALTQIPRPSKKELFVIIATIPVLFFSIKYSANRINFI